jgi:spore coat protein A, manganese oxidase
MCSAMSAPTIPSAAADPGSTGQIMRFNVGPARSPDPTTAPQFLTLPPIAILPPETVTRPLALLEAMSMFFEDAPLASLP